jgi:hypothetical protein
MATLKERYKNLKTLVVERKEPFSLLMHHLETETAWLTADPFITVCRHLERFRAREPAEKAEAACAAVCIALQVI